MSPSPPPQHNDEPRGFASPAERSRHALVLIVDDSLDTRELYAEYLRQRGWRAITAPDGATGIATAIRTKPDVIVMDLAMPGINGVSAAHHLKHDPRSWEIPIILLTAHANRASQDSALEIGVDVFLTKPCLPEDLESHVQRLIQVRQSPP